MKVLGTLQNKMNKLVALCLRASSGSNEFQCVPTWGLGWRVGADDTGRKEVAKLHGGSKEP